MVDFTILIGNLDAGDIISVDPSCTSHTKYERRLTIIQYYVHANGTLVYFGYILEVVFLFILIYI